jgi:peptidyl-prolyl cis-trans isomerase C
MKKKLAVVVLGAFLVTGLFGCGNKVPDGTVATVNGEAISQETLDTNYSQLLQMYQFYGYDISDDSLRTEVRNNMLNSLVMQELLLQEAANRGLSVTDEEVEESIQDMADRYGSQEDLEAAVEEAGMTMEYFTQTQKEQLLLSKLQEELVNNPEPADVIQAKHILVDTEEEANDIIAQLDDGADFDTLAKEYSTDTSSAAEGGELGYFSVPNGSSIPRMMVAEFTEGAQALEVGEYSKTPVQSDYGYHIIYVEDKQSGVNLLDDSEKYGSILSTIYNYGLTTLSDNLYAEADKNGKIKILLDEESVPAIPEILAQDDETDADVDADTDADAADTADNSEQAESEAK